MRDDFDVAILGAGLIGSAAALTFARRGYRCVVLESRPAGRAQKVVVGEAVTEGSSLYLRHELGLEPWFQKNAYRKFGFDFLTLPDDREARTIEDCHELMLSQAPLEQIPQAYSQLIPTYHVERPPLNDHVAELAEQAGVEFRRGAGVEFVALGEGESPHEVHYLAEAGRPSTAGKVRARWVLDASGRKCLLSRQLGLHRKVDVPSTAAVWNRFEDVESDPSVWRSFHGIDRRKHTIHMTGRGFWAWWIHQNDGSTSIGITWDKEQHAPNVKAPDCGFAEMAAKFPPLAPLIARARAKEPWQLYGHLAYRSTRWIDDRRFAILGDAAWFTDALYSVGLETALRQLVFVTHAVEGDLAGRPMARAWFDGLNRGFDFTSRAVAKLNEFKYKHGWHRPYVLAQTVLYETAEIGPLYQVQRKEDWVYEKQRMYYGLQWGTQKRMDALDRFLAEALADDVKGGLYPSGGLLKKGLLPGPWVYRATWPLWNGPGWHHYFFRLIRAWGFMERMAQRHRGWPDVLTRMAMSKRDASVHLLRSVAGAARPRAEAESHGARRAV
jgi:flavin-dependent dehydrogenase